MIEPMKCAEFNKFMNYYKKKNAPFILRLPKLYVCNIPANFAKY